MDLRSVGVAFGGSQKPMLTVQDKVRMKQARILRKFLLIISMASLNFPFLIL